MPGFSFSTVRWVDVMCDEPFNAHTARIFTSLIRVKDGRGAVPFSDGFFQNIENECGGVIEPDLPLNDFSGEGVNEGSENIVSEQDIFCLTFGFVVESSTRNSKTTS